MLLQVEEQDKKQGYIDRVKSYNDLKETNRIVRDCQKQNNNCDQKKAIEILKKKNVGTDKRGFWKQLLNM